MSSRSARVFAVLTAVGLLGAVMAAPSGAATRTAAQVTKKSLQIVLIVPDIDALRAKGINVSNLSTADFTKRFQGYVDAFGPINGRKIEVKAVGWDPIDATSFDKACTAAAIDNKPFVVINGSGFQGQSIPCISVDNKTPFISGDMAYGQLLKASGKNLLTIGLPAEVAANAAAALVAKTGVVPKTAKIGILSSNIPGIKAAADTLEAQLKKRGYDVVSKVELNGLAADAGLLNRESAAAADTFQAKGVDTVFNTQSFTQLSGFFGEVEKGNLDFKVYGIDGQANACTPFSAGRAAYAEGTTCITAWDTKSVATKDSLKPDNALEAKCRKEFDAATGKKSLPGGTSGATTINGVTYEGDLAPPECMIANLLLPAIKKAGKNPTWDKVYANLLATTKAPAAYLSQGQGGFGKNKPYFANPVMHFEMMVNATADTPKDANGLYNGCGIPGACWVPVLVNGQEWFKVSANAKA